MTKVIMLRIFLTEAEIAWVHEQQNTSGTLSDQAAAELHLRFLAAADAKFREKVAELKPVDDDSCLNDENAGAP